MKKNQSFVRKIGQLIWLAVICLLCIPVLKTDAQPVQDSVLAAKEIANNPISHREIYCWFNVIGGDNPGWHNYTGIWQDDIVLPNGRVGGLTYLAYDDRKIENVSENNPIRSLPRVKNGIMTEFYGYTFAVGKNGRVIMDGNFYDQELKSGEGIKFQMRLLEKQSFLSYVLRGGISGATLYVQDSNGHWSGYGYDHESGGFFPWLDPTVTSFPYEIYDQDGNLIDSGTYYPSQGGGSVSSAGNGISFGQPGNVTKLDLNYGYIPNNTFETDGSHQGVPAKVFLIEKDYRYSISGVVYHGLDDSHPVITTYGIDDNGTQVLINHYEGVDDFETEFNIVGAVGYSQIILVITGDQGQYFEFEVYMYTDNGKG